MTQIKPLITEKDAAALGAVSFQQPRKQTGTLHTALGYIYYTLAIVHMLSPNISQWADRSFTVVENIDLFFITSLLITVGGLYHFVVDAPFLPPQFSKVLFMLPAPFFAVFFVGSFSRWLPLFVANVVGASRGDSRALAISHGAILVAHSTAVALSLWQLFMIAKQILPKEQGCDKKYSINPNRNVITLVVLGTSLIGSLSSSLPAIIHGFSKNTAAGVPPSVGWIPFVFTGPLFMGGAMLLISTRVQLPILLNFIRPVLDFTFVMSLVWILAVVVPGESSLLVQYFRGDISTALVRIYISCHAASVVSGVIAAICLGVTLARTDSFIPFPPQA